MKNDDNNDNTSTGSISVSPDATVTPITRTPIDVVDSNQWNDMTIDQLYQQQHTLNTRLQYAHQIGHIVMIEQIQRGLHQLYQVINSRMNQQGK